ncbi:adrenodoxin, mitochondrial [Takifugu rubripes]|uniref:2Fe-2S ferredoxin-type domain-containing protein n=1 Tax=Takifugu rubripes TaxID=31033 RepID=A0A3B5KMZ4_TAKRU|nr:adrenodoxin, mitochondrial [Takifugu rubripes]XP_056883558.1 adrenodoxin, mitochondrial-like [Takifugu flavidus]|eukprot:XP_003966509.1 PREDICTED: adrenodoxin, mitochondrial [Takifugu rubripes]
MALVAALRRLSHASLGFYSWRAAAATPTFGAWITGQRSFTVGSQPLRSDKVTVHFINRDGDKITVKGSPGESLLDVVINEDLDIDGFGACEGTLACSTCHLIFEDDVFKKLGRITDEEMDMLDLAYGLTDTSRLGCQVCLSKSLDGLVAKVPESVADARQSQDG